MNKKVCKNYITCKASRLLQHAHTPLHCIYLGAVSIEAHGFYGIAAGGLLVTVLYNVFTGEEND